MNVQQLRDHFQARNNLELAKKIQYARSTLTLWEQNGIPLKTQAYFQVISGGKLKADSLALGA